MAIQEDRISLDAAMLQVHTDLFGICPDGHTQARASCRGTARHLEDTSLQSLLQGGK